MTRRVLGLRVLGLRAETYKFQIYCSGLLRAQDRDDIKSSHLKLAPSELGERVQSGGAL